MNALTITSRTSNTSAVTDDESALSTITERANATVSDKIQLKILKLLKDIQSDMKANNHQMNLVVISNVVNMWEERKRNVLIPPNTAGLAVHGTIVE